MCIFEDGCIVAKVKGVEIRQGLFIKVARLCLFLNPLFRDQHNGHKFDVMGMIEKISILQNDVFNLPNMPFDGGSSTFEESVVFNTFLQLISICIIQRNMAFCII